MRRILWIGLILALPAVALAGRDALTIKLREASVRSGPKHFKPVVATLKYGDKVENLNDKDGWYEVKTATGVQGFLHETAVSEKEVAKLQPGAEGTSPSTVSNDEVALAGKGFNPQVEKQYKQDHPTLDASFKKVDAMERRKVERSVLEQFLNDGKLGGKP